jgi:hypothetical protein
MVTQIIENTGIPLEEAQRIGRNCFIIGTDMQEKGASKEEIDKIINDYYNVVIRAYLEGSYHG